MKTLLKISAIFLLFLTTSCFLDGVKGNRNVITQNRNISSDFDALHVSYGIDVKLTMGNTTSLKLEADENLHDIIRTEVKDGVLKIYSEKNIYSSKKRTVYLTATDLNEIKVTSGANVSTKNTLNAEVLKVSTTSGANVNLNLDVADVSCSSTSGSNARLSGKAEQLTVSATSGANIRAKGLEALVCEARATSGSVVAVHVTKELDAKATSGANISCSGDPEIIRKNSNSGGNIRT